ncbi:MAG: 2-phosphosulfolactate phosphatase [Bacillota bacterium]
MSEITVLATPDLLLARDLTGYAAAVIDVLRATSSIATAFSSGCQKLIPARSKEQALIERAGHEGAILTGEQGGLKIPGFDLGNSPLEYTPQNVAGRTIVMTTSNGTRAVLGASEAGASPVFLCSFLNLTAVASACAQAALSEDGSPKGVAIVCSGEHGQFSLEDFACAGALASAISSLGDFSLDSSARAASSLYEAYGRDALRVLRDSPHGQDLIGMGFSDDLAHCAKVGALDVVPRFSGGSVTLHRKIDNPRQR